MTRFPQLLSPTSLGPVELRNRVVSTSHQTSLVDGHVPTEDLVAYQRARAAGGVGAIFLEATAVHASGLLTSHTIGGYLPAIVPAYQRLGDAVRSHGARLFVQLFHGGREQIASAPRPPAVAPSAVPTLRFHTEPRALSRSEIRELIAGFATSARHAREGGVDGMELSAAHGYLAAQFFGRGSNRRDDEYNGALDAQLRFTREVLEAIRREAGPGLAVGVRLAADEMTPDGLDADACAEIARLLAQDGLVDFVSLAVGHSSTYFGSVYIVPPPPSRLNLIEQPAAVVRRAVPAGVPIIATSRVFDPLEAERILADGTAELIGMTRALIADPELVRKLEEGRELELIECIGCNQGCIGHYHTGTPIACTVNPRTGRERTLAPAVRSATGRKVLVIGAGPAGMAAAVEAAALGDHVTLLERSDGVGGQMRRAGKGPSHDEVWQRYWRLSERAVFRAQVLVKLRHEATAADAEGFDLIVVATGAKPFQPELPADDRFTVVQAWDALEKPEAIEGPALIADWGGGWDGLDAAELLAAHELDVELACAAPVPGETVHQYQRNIYLGRLDVAGVVLRNHLRLTHEEGRLTLEHIFSGRQEQIGDHIKTIVLAQGREPEDALWQRLQDMPNVVRVGDVLGPRSAEEAILEGTLAVRSGVQASMSAD